MQFQNKESKILFLLAMKALCQYDIHSLKLEADNKNIPFIISNDNQILYKYISTLNVLSELKQYPKVDLIFYESTVREIDARLGQLLNKRADLFVSLDEESQSHLINSFQIFATLPFERQFQLLCKHDDILNIA